MDSYFGGVESFDLFRGALPEAVFWGRIALGVGVGGLLVSILLVLGHFRDRLSLRSGGRNPAAYRPPKWGPLDRCLREFFADPLHAAPLSPDAASEYVSSRLDAEHDVSHSIVRYFAYAPLLLGLMGTTFALRTLLVTSGETLQEIQPQLSGVFAGTIAGIAGALLAAVGGLVLDRVALSSANSAQDFIHRFIIPTLPERRIAIRIEDAVLAVISERAGAVAESFRTAIQPVATELEAVATRCGAAAQAATDAFSEAVRAVKEAGDLEVASRNFKAGAHMIDSSAEQLSDATKQTAEIILRVGEVRGSLSNLVERIQSATETLSTSSERVGGQLETQLAAIITQVSKLENSATGLRVVTETLSIELTRRAQSDSQQIEATNKLLEMTGRQLVDIGQTTLSSSSDIKRLSAAVAAVEAKAEAVSERIGPRLDESAERTQGALKSLHGVVDRNFAAVSTTLDQMRRRSDGDGAQNREVQGLRQAVNDLRALADEARGSRRGLETAPSKGFFRWPWN